MNTNGTIRGLFYHFIQSYFERLAKTYQFLKIFVAVIQDHLDIEIDIDIDTLLTSYSVVCCTALRILQT